MTGIHRLPTTLLRAVLAVTAAALVLLGALTLQNLAGHVDEPVPTLAGTTQAASTPDREPPVVHVDAHDGVGTAFCALMGFMVLVLTAVAAAFLVRAASGLQLFQLARTLAARPVDRHRGWSAVSLTRLSIARV
jgi:hypothetical protein